MYLSVQYCCFYSNIFGWENNIQIDWKDVSRLTKESSEIHILSSFFFVQSCLLSHKSFVSKFSMSKKIARVLWKLRPIIGALVAINVIEWNFLEYRFHFISSIFRDLIPGLYSELGLGENCFCYSQRHSDQDEGYRVLLYNIC